MRKRGYRRGYHKFGRRRVKRIRNYRMSRGGVRL